MFGIQMLFFACSFLFANKFVRNIYFTKTPLLTGHVTHNDGLFREVPLFYRF